MALKASIFKIELSIADLDRHVYEDFSLTLARHPSENDARMMVRLLAFMRYADAALTFGKGLSTDEEPDLWLKDMTGAVHLWILVGQPDERWLRKASGRSEQVAVFSHGDRVAEVWWGKNQQTLSKLQNLTVYRLTTETTQALASLVERNMRLQCTIQDGEMLVSSEKDTVRVEPLCVFPSDLS